jgi:ubiquinone/menaquinone biosynthesis C-methylase UbiE
MGLENKKEVKDFWSKSACAEKLYLDNETTIGFKKHLRIRYELEPFILSFADFPSSKGKNVLEIGVGLGADHQCFAEAGAILTGIDLTSRAINMTQKRLETVGLKGNLKVGDAENLDFPDNSFDIVYSWGVIHHSPNTQQAVNEIFRVLSPGGVVKVMIYYKYSLVGLMLWLRYALFRGKPFTSLASIYSNYLESPGTKAYSFSQAKDLFSQFRHVSIKTQLSHGDLLTSKAGQRFDDILLRFMRAIWPRWFFKMFFEKNGLFMMIEAKK